ncbi:MAG: CT253 family lipoprotein [Anaerolineae bacterium]
MFRTTLSLIAILLMIGCVKNQNRDYARYHDDGRSKPIVALVPFIDRTLNDLPWSLSQELTSTIMHRLMQKDKLYLIDEQRVLTAVKKLSDTNDPFGTQLQWVRKSFPDEEFVVFLELVEHEEVPIMHQKASSSLDAPAELNMSVRVRILDLRGEHPVAILQELIHDTHSIPRQFTKANFIQVPWGKDSYSISPLGLAHAQLIKELVSRIEDYILLAKSN